MANIKSTIGKGVKRYGELLSGSGVKRLRTETLMKGDRATKAKNMINDTLNVAKTKKPGARNSELEKVISLKRAGNKAYDSFNNAYGRYKNELIKSTGARLGTGAAVGGAIGLGSKALKNREEKTASEIVEESFDKVASLKFKKSKNIGKALKNVATGKNIKNAIDDIKVAGNAGAYKDTLRRLKGDRNKEIAKTVGLHATGLAGIGGAGFGATRLKKKEK